MRFKHSLFAGAFVLFLFTSIAISQIKIDEGFETLDSNHLPAGWSKCYGSTFPVSYNPYSNWTVRDSGKWMPGLPTVLTQAHISLKSCGVSWLTGYDTSGIYHISDAWLVTKKITNIASTDILKFWISGGTGAPNNWVDSVQVWVNFIDSLPGNFTTKLGSIVMTGLPYGTWTLYTYSLSGFVGSNLYIGFRYNTDCLNQGFAVYLDDVFVGNPNAINQIGTGVPAKIALSQNYPNPFNPLTTIKFDIPKSSHVKMVVYNTLGQVVSEVINETKAPGYYEVKLDASKLSSGPYFYRIEAGSFVETKKMVVIK
jgi:hypothetical protein